MPEAQVQHNVTGLAPFQARLKAELRALFVQAGIVKELEQRLLQKWLAVQPGDPEAEEFLCQQLPQAIEEYFAELRSHCQAYIRQLLRNPDRTEDLVQEALLRLIREKNQVQYIQAWLRKVIYHLVVEQFRQDKAQSEFLRQLQEESADLDELASLPEMFREEDEFAVLLPEMLAHPDFLALQEMKRYPNLRAWAQALQISYEQAKQRSKVHKRNLRAACLRKLGWASTPDILNHQEYKALQRYVREFLQAGFEAVKGNAPTGRFKAFRQELEQGFQGFAKLHSWDIVDLGNSGYRVYIVGVGPLPSPILISTMIRIKENHRIATDLIKRHEIMGKLEVPLDYVLPTEKGKCLLTKQQVEDLIRPLP